MSKENKSTEAVEQNADVKASKKQEIIRALKFFLFSCSAGVIQFGVFTVLNTVVGWQFWPSHLLALALSVVWNFTFNRKFTFKSAVNVPKAMLLAFLFYIPFTPATVFGGQALVNLGWNSLLVEALTMVLNLVLEFFWSKYVTFRNNIDTASEKTESTAQTSEQPATDVEATADNVEEKQETTASSTEEIAPTQQSETPAEK